MEPPDGRPDAPTAEEAVPVIDQNPETARLVEPEPAAELDGVRVDDVTEQPLPEQEDGAQPTADEQGETISITLKEFVTGNAFQVVHGTISGRMDVTAYSGLCGALTGWTCTACPSGMGLCVDLFADGAIWNDNGLGPLMIIP